MLSNPAPSRTPSCLAPSCSTARTSPSITGSVSRDRALSGTPGHRAPAVTPRVRRGGRGDAMRDPIPRAARGGAVPKPLRPLPPLPQPPQSWWRSGAEPPPACARGASSERADTRLPSSFPAEGGGETVTSGIAGAGFEGRVNRNGLLEEMRCADFNICVR